MKMSTVHHSTLRSSAENIMDGPWNIASSFQLFNKWGFKSVHIHSTILTLVPW